MFHGCRRWVSSLVCVFCILSMLFLDTCIVKAFTINDLVDAWVTNSALNSQITLSSTPTDSSVYDVSAPVSFSATTRDTASTSGSITTSTGSVSGTVTNTYTSGQVDYWCYHFKVPINLYVTANQDILPNDLYAVVMYPGFSNLTGGSITNFCITRSGDIMGAPSTSSVPIHYFKGMELIDGNGGVSNSVGMPCFLEFDFTYSQLNGLTDTVSRNFTFDFTVGLWTGHVNNNISQQDISVVDSVTHDELSDLNDTQESIKDTTEDTNTKITDFFGSFFDNLLHIFVPEDGYFSEWFDKVNTLLSDKLGMLYAPFDLVISTLQAIYSADSTETGIPFPGIKWEDTWLVEPFTFTFDSLGSNFDDLREKVYFATDTVLVLTFLMLLQSKVKLILEGHE